MRERCVTLVCACFAIMVGIGLAAAEGPDEHPLEPPDRSSPRATLRTFLGGVDHAWELYSARDKRFNQAFRDARECLDLSEIPPLVMREASTKKSLMIKEVLDRIELPAESEIPDVVEVTDLGLTRWTVPHTEIALLRVSEGEREGEWLFSTGTVLRIDHFYDRVRHLPYQPGRKGGHVAELSSGSRATVLMGLAQVLPPWFSGEIGGMLVWQWFGLALLVSLLFFAVVAVGVLGRRWRESTLAGHRLAGFLVPMAMISCPFVVQLMIERLFPLPGAPALAVRLLFSIVGYAGLAWLAALILTRIGEATVHLAFRNARPLKKQLVRVVFRVATIAVITGIAVKALQILGVPIAGLIAGVGVGGFAIALAAQSTLENFIGGIILFADQPVRVGDECNFGSRRGTVEDVGLRSVKIRTLDRTVVTVPNADFAKMQLENLSERDKILIREKICLQYGTPGDRLRNVLSGIESMLREHPRIGEDRIRVRFMGFGEHYQEVEVFAYALTDQQSEFFEIREDVLLKVMQIVDDAGTRLALPTEIHYIGTENGDQSPLAT